MGTTTGITAALAVSAGLGGLVAYLAGLAGLRDLRRLRQVGVPVRALVRERIPGPEDRSAASRPLLQFTTEDGRVVEVFSPVPASRRAPSSTARTSPSATTRRTPARSSSPGASAADWSTSSWGWAASWHSPHSSWWS